MRFISLGLFGQGFVLVNFRSSDYDFNDDDHDDLFKSLPICLGHSIPLFSGLPHGYGTSILW